MFLDEFELRMILSNSSDSVNWTKMLYFEKKNKDCCNVQRIVPEDMFEIPTELHLHFEQIQQSTLLSQYDIDLHNDLEQNT